uniref:Outer membrane protein TolC n=1 Tax=Candidatus Kentrum sp. SD TaxID=2126332 RepID=A0A450YZH9_9GAMM|nr:MAG: Outer membrane protein TolC [Candidatus Kentron sp. SD]VFK46929.1 MAG: Outer membrane protein TolC [Candidatus Kentron sp. SD]
MIDPMTRRGRLRRLVHLIMPIPFVALLVACTMTPERLIPQNLGKQIREEMKALFAEETEPLPAVLTLSEATARALKYNLDHRLKRAEETLALDRLGIDRFDFLPKSRSKIEHRVRSKPDVIVQNSNDTNNADDSHYYYSEKQTTSSDLVTSWNILDFGISYYTAKQNTDRALIAEEHRRRTIHKLIGDVRSAYWRLAARQALEDPIRDILELAQGELTNIDIRLREKLKPLEANRYKKMLLESIRKLESINRELSTAHITLAALINAKPGIEIRVAAPESGFLQPPEWNTAIDQMEELAFRYNPDIRRGFYNARIAVRETHKEIVRTLPGIELTGAYRYDSNDRLRNNDWYEWSTRLTWGIFNILSAPERIEYAELGVEAAEMERVALQMAVLAQVHVADRQFWDARKQFELADSLFQVNHRIAELVEKGLLGNQSINDFVYEQTDAIASQLRRYYTYAELEAAHGRIHATLGLDIALRETGDLNLEEMDLREITVMVDDALSTWKRGDLLAQRALARHGKQEEKGEEDKGGETMPAEDAYFMSVTRALARHGKQGDKGEENKGGETIIPTEDAYFISATGMDMDAKIVKMSLTRTYALGDDRVVGSDDSADWSNWKGYRMSTSVSN